MNKPKNLLPQPKTNTPYKFIIVNCVEGVSRVGNPKIDLYCDIADGESKGYYANNPKVRPLPIITAKGNATKYGSTFIDIVEKMNNFKVDWECTDFASQFIGKYVGGVLVSKYITNQDGKSYPVKDIDEFVLIGGDA